MNLIWFGVRSVCLFGKKKDGKNIYEERVLVFSGSNWQEAVSKAMAEMKEYTGFLKTVGYSEVVGYEQDGEPMIDGYEVWSEMYETTEDLDAFVESRYKKYKYQPDE